MANALRSTALSAEQEETLLSVPTEFQTTLPDDQVEELHRRLQKLAQRQSDRAEVADAGRMMLFTALGLVMLLFGTLLYRRSQPRPRRVEYLGTLVADPDYDPSPHLVERLSARSPELEERWPRRVTVLSPDGKDLHFKVQYDE